MKENYAENKNLQLWLKKVMRDKHETCYITENAESVFLIYYGICLQIPNILGKKPFGFFP